MITPRGGATVRVDGEVVGVTPWRGRLEVGDHELRVESDDHEPHTERITVTAAGRTRVAVRLRATTDAIAPIPNPAPRSADHDRPKRITGAPPIPRSDYALTTWVGYPHFVGAGVRTGVLDGARKVDLTVALETYFTRWDLAIGASTPVHTARPVAVSAFGAVAAGLATGGQNGLTLTAGAIATIDTRNWLALSARVGVVVWNDRLCAQPSATDPGGVPTRGPRVCGAGATADDLMQASDALGETITDPRQLQVRDWGARPVVGLGAEVTRRRNPSYWVQLESSPGFGGRPAHTQVFSPILVKGGLGLELQLGAGWRF